MSNNYFYKQKTVRKHSRHTPKTNKIITIKAYDRKQRYRNYAKISRTRAQQLFEQRSQRAKTLDLKTTSKKVFDAPNEYWEKYMGRSDVKGIDTKRKITKSKISEDFYQDFFDSGEKQKIIHETESKILRCKHEINYFETYHKSALKSDDWNTIKEKYNNWQKELKENEAKLKKTQFIWQEEPSSWYYHEEDPRYTKMKAYVKEDIVGIKQQIRVLKSKLDNVYIRSSEKYEYAKDIEKKSEELELLDAKLKKLEEKPREIYWDDNLIEETIKRGKGLPYPVRKVMPERHKQQYEYMTKRREVIREAKERLSEKKLQTRQKRLELSNIQFKKLKQLRDTKLGKDWDDKEEVINSPHLGSGLFSDDHISMITTTRDMKKTTFYKTRKVKGKELTLNHLTIKNGELFLTNPKTDNAYLKKYVDQALNNFKNPKLNYEKDTPLTIIGDNYSMMIAPLMEEEKGDMIPIKEYKRLSKLTKKQLGEIEGIDTTIKSNLSGKKMYFIFDAYKHEKAERK